VGAVSPHFVYRVIKGNNQLTQQGKFLKILDSAIVIVGCAMAFYHLTSTQYLFVDYLEHQIFHLGFALLLVFLTSMRALKRRKLWPLILTLLLAGLVVVSYMKIYHYRLEEVIGIPGTVDMIIGVILVIVVIEATRQAWGPILPIIAIVFILYFFFGQLLPEASGLAHGGFAPSYIISVLGIGFSGTFGLFLTCSANYIFLFLVFSGLLGATGALGLIFEVGKAAGRVLAGGPAHTAVIGSSLVGTVTGAAVANVAITGAFTIPLMKKVGYHPDMAGAIEATASTGAQLMPPVMGASAFVMAAVIGVPYVEIMIAAIIPALLYYYTVGLGVQVIAVKRKIFVPREAIDTKLILHRAPVFLIPLAVIIVLLLMRFSPMYAAFYAIIAVLVLSFIRKETRPSWSRLVWGFSEGAISGAKIAVALSCVGIMAQVLYSTALGVKFSGLVGELCGGYLFLALLMTMIVSIILGCGLPTVGAYVLVALVVCPALVRLGMPVMPAHFFAFYFAIISALTPPVALAALAGAGISGGNYWKTSINAFKLAIAGFVLPFFMVYNPVFMLRGGEPLSGVVSLIAAFIAMSALIAVVYNHFLVPISQWQRAVYALCAASSFAYVFTGNYILFALGMLLFLRLMMLQWRTRKLAKGAYRLKSRIKEKEVE